MKKLLFLLMVLSVSPAWTQQKVSAAQVQQAPSMADGRILLKLAPGARADAVRRLPGCLAICPIAPHADAGLMLLTYDPNTVTASYLLERLKKMDIVLMAQPDEIITLPQPEKPQKIDMQHLAASPVADGSPDDPLFSQQWGLKAIRMPELWQVPLKSGAKRPVIAIIDTGVDTEHPDLKDNIWTNEAELNGLPGVDDDGNGFIDDIHGWNFFDSTNVVTDEFGHGTQCAGIAAAVAGNGTGIAGANPDALIMPLRVSYLDYADYQIHSTASSIIAAIDYAIAMGADVVSLSMGGVGRSQYDMLEQTCRHIIIVAAAGNENAAISTGESTNYPGALPGIFGVEASDESGWRPSWSNYDDDGPWMTTYIDGENYELRAPGDNIVTTMPDGEYASSGGTSMATPLVSGLISRLICLKDYASHDELLRDLILSRGPGLGDVDAMKAYSPTKQMATLQVTPQYILWKDMDEHLSIRNISVLNLSDSTLTGLHAVIETASDSSAIQILQPSQAFPALQAGAVHTLPSSDWTYTLKDDDGTGARAFKITLYNWDETIDSFTLELPSNAEVYYEGGFHFEAIDDDNVQLTGYTGGDTCIIPATIRMNGRVMTVKKIKKLTFNANLHLKYVYLPDGLTSIGSYAFCDCSRLEGVRFPDGLTTVNTLAFWNCTALKEVVLPEGLKKIGNSTFYGCVSLTKAVLPEALTEIADMAFLGCKKLTDVLFPEGLTKIGELAFGECRSLTQAVLPERLSEIADMAFDGCSGLKSLQFNGVVDYIGWGAFACDSLMSVISLAETPYDYTDEIFTATCLEQATLYVPCGCTEVYKSTTCWGGFHNIVELNPAGLPDVEEETDEADAMNGPYDLFGRKVQRSSPGIIVRNGKKYIDR